MLRPEPPAYNSTIFPSLSNTSNPSIQSLPLLQDRFYSYFSSFSLEGLSSFFSAALSPISSAFGVRSPFGIQIPSNNCPRSIQYITTNPDPERPSAPIPLSPYAPTSSPARNSITRPRPSDHQPRVWIGLTPAYPPSVQVLSSPPHLSFPVQ